jgi:cullin-4
VEQPSEPD